MQHERDEIRKEDIATILKILLMASRNEPAPAGFIDALDKLFLVQIIKKRIGSLKLNISFDPYAYAFVPILCSSPGMVIVLLIDCLNYLGDREDRTITAKDLWSLELYGDGFYSQKGFEARHKELTEQKNKFLFIY